jgi:outer membrane protein OmpA-like peptidoglycan-associated protein
MNGEYDRLRQLLLEQERGRMDALQDSVGRATARFERVPDLLAEDIEASLRDGKRSRLANVLSEASADSLEIAVRRRPQAVVQAVYPIIGPAIRRSLSDALRQMADDLDRALSDTFSPRALLWRWEAWRSGTPYAQVMLRHTTRYQVEHLFLIAPESGLLLGHLTASGLPALDADAVAGMFTAIQQFVRDSVTVDEDGASIGSATVGDYRLAVSEGPGARLVAFVRGVPSSDFGLRLDELNEELHARYGAQWGDAGSAGVAGAGLLEQRQLDELNSCWATRHGGARPQRRKYVWATLALAALALLFYAALGWRWSSQVSAIGRHLSATPGLVVSRLDDGARGRLRIEGLMDPLASDPRAWLRQHYPEVEVEIRTRPFVSLEPQLVQRRVAQTLHLPEAAVRAPDAQGMIRLTGSVPFPDWYRARATSLSTPGVTGIDYDGLSYPQKPQIDAAIASIQSLKVPFVSGTLTPDAGWEDVLAEMGRKLQALERTGATASIAFHLQTAGLTDEPGTLDENRNLRQQRAEWLASRLAAQLHPPSTIAVNQDAAFALPWSARVRAAAVAVQPYPAPVAR